MSYPQFPLIFSFSLKLGLTSAGWRFSQPSRLTSAPSLGDFVSQLSNAFTSTATLTFPCTNKINLSMYKLLDRGHKNCPKKFSKVFQSAAVFLKLFGKVHLLAVIETAAFFG